MKTPKLLSIIIALLFIAAINNNAYSQCQAYIKVDGKLINASQISSNGLTLPLWLQEGQSIAADQMVNSISVIEFNVNSTTSALEFSQVLSVTTVQTVPNDKVWKVESILKTTSSLSDVNGAVFSNGGTYNFTVPTCASYICIEVWGAGGGGSTSATGGGGGGAYGQSCFSVLPGTQLTVVVGNAGDFNSSGGSTSVSGSGISTISVAGGSGGSGTSGGAGGSSITNATVAIPGGNGASSAYVGNSEYFGGNGGAAGGGPINSGGNGGIGGYYKSGTTILATAAGFPGGGGGGKGEVGAAASKGAHGKVIITW